MPRWSLLGLRSRLAAAFVAVALAAVGGQSALALLVAGDRVSGLVEQQNRDTASSVTLALARAYRAAGGWPGADTGPAAVLASLAGAELQVRDASGATVEVSRPMATMMAQMRGGASGGALGAPSVLPIRARGVMVGHAVFRFPARLPRAQASLADALRRTVLLGAALAALLAVAVAAVTARRITRPLRSLTSAARAMAAGDRDARAALRVGGELGELGGAFDRMADTVAHEDRLRRALAADVAHELRTPTAVLLAYTEQLADGLAEPTPERLRSLHDEVVRLTRSVEDVETLASADGASLHLALEPVELDAIAASVATAMRPRFEAADITLQVDLHATPVTGDPDRLAQIVRNLLSNALKFTPPGGRVTVAAHAIDGVALLSVADTGIGVPADEREHIFDRFWRGPGAATIGGTGVGLAVVFQLVTAHRGVVHVSSRPGGGTVFTVHLRAEACRSEPRTLR